MNMSNSKFGSPKEAQAQARPAFDMEWALRVIAETHLAQAEKITRDAMAKANLELASAKSALAAADAEAQRKRGATPSRKLEVMDE